MIMTRGYTLDALNAPFVLEDIELCEPGPNEVLVEIKAVGICHTDASARNGLIPFPFPGVLGHEGAGIVVKTGALVEEFSVGDQVAMSYGYCGKCLPCRKGKTYACQEMVPINFGGASWDGTKKIYRRGKALSSFFAQSSFAQHALVHENSLVKIPKEFPIKMAGPLGCGIQTDPDRCRHCIKQLEARGWRVPCRIRMRCSRHERYYGSKNCWLCEHHCGWRQF